MEEKKEFGFSKSIKTNICLEKPAVDNPYLAEKRYISGYDIEQMATKCSYIDSLYLLFKSELPEQKDSVILNMLFVGLMNLGPRHPAIRASMIAGISKTNAEHLLPIGLSTLGGEKGGAAEVELAHIFINNSLALDPVQCARSITNNHKGEDQHIAPGFGCSFGDKDPIINRLAQQIMQVKPDSRIFNWCTDFTAELSLHNMGFLTTGLAAAIFLELGIDKRGSVGLFQLACAPGIFAQGVEQTHRPITDMPLLEDEHYELR